MRFFKTPALFACAFAAAALAPSEAAAQSNEVSPTGKGIAGGALLGAEAVMVTEAALGVRPAWAYGVGGGIGAVAGGVGGYFAEDGGDAKISLYMLALGMTFAIPTTVAVLSATSYEPAADFTEDRGPTDEPVADPPQPAAETGTRVDTKKKVAKSTPKERALPATPPPSAHMKLSRLGPPALVGYGQGSMLLSVPAVEVRDMYTQEQMQQFGVQQRTEVRVPVLNVVF